MRRVIKRARATVDLANVWTYSFGQWGAGHADFIIEELERRCAMLAEFPMTGADCDEISRGLRRLIVGHHLVFYFIREDWIEIVRVLHERMDATRQLEE